MFNKYCHYTDEVDSLATDDEAIEMELKKTRVPSKKKESKKKLAKDRAALKEARRLEKQVKKMMALICNECIILVVISDHTFLEICWLADQLSNLD